MLLIVGIGGARTSIQRGNILNLIVYISRCAVFFELLVKVKLQHSHLMLILFVCSPKPPLSMQRLASLQPFVYAWLPPCPCPFCFSHIFELRIVHLYRAWRNLRCRPRRYPQTCIDCCMRTKRHAPYLKRASCERSAHSDSHFHRCSLC